MALQKEKTPMRSQKPEDRIKNFKEVPFGYNKKEALQEAERCLQCPKSPCVDGCPVNVPIPEFIKALRDEGVEKASKIIKDKNNLPAICGRVCPQESQCEKLCVMGAKNEPVAIGRLERYVADEMIKKESNISKNNIKDIKEKPNNKSCSNKKKVAIVGAGPAGLTCAGDLAREGFNVTIFEALHDTGGVLRYGIPEFRLPKDILDKEVEYIKDLGVDIRVNAVIGKTLTVDELFDEGYQAVFIGTGAGLPRFMGIPGENLNGVYSANEFLTRVNLMKGYKYPEYRTPVKIGNKVVVVGAGNVAMDAARTAKRLGASEVTVVYRRSEKEMPARDEEIEHAKEEGIIFKLLNNPVKITGENGQVAAMECVKMKLGEPDASGRRRPIPIEGSNWIMDIDTMIVAIGQTPNPLLTQNTRDLKTESWGGIIVDEKMGTSRKGVYAGGDIVTGAATVIEAMGAGKTAAQSIKEYLEKE